MEGLTLSAKELSRLQVLNAVISGQWYMAEAARSLWSSSLGLRIANRLPKQTIQRPFRVPGGDGGELNSA